MLIKPTDDRQPDITALEALLHQSDLDARQRREIQDEIWAIRLGAKAERDAAYQLDFDLRDSKHWAVIHDLRIDLDGRVAQIDHVVISRMLEVFVCESKSYTGGVKVNDHGEWSTYRDRRPVGIPSPVEQNRRHIKVIEEVIDRGLVRLPRRIVQIKPAFKNIVLVSAGGLITRPKRKLPELDAVVKVDQFRTYLMNRDFPDHQILKFVGSDTLADFGRQLVALHQPAKVDWAARFGIALAESPQRTRGQTAGPPWLVKYDGPCSICGRILMKGTEAVWNQRKRKLFCLGCAATAD